MPKGGFYFLAKCTNARPWPHSSIRPDSDSLLQLYSFAAVGVAAKVTKQAGLAAASFSLLAGWRLNEASELNACE